MNPDLDGTAAAAHVCRVKAEGSYGSKKQGVLMKNYYTKH